MEIINKIINDLNNYYKDTKRDFELIQDDLTLENTSIFKKKYPHVRCGIRAKITTIIGYNISIKDYINFHNNNINHIPYTDEEIEIIYKYAINKIRGIFKHAQAFKTGYCNLKIMEGFDNNDLTIAITKNSLEATQQWMQRIFKDIDRNWPSTKINKKIIVISSKKNTLDGNATHCKNINDAWALISNEDNDFSVVFLCSNKIRINDVLSLIKHMSTLRGDLIKKINIIHDEAHNVKEGIPAYRIQIENIILHPLINLYIPCTASMGSIVDAKNPLWQKSNLELKSLDYTDFDKTKSTDDNYSSCSDAIKITFEDLITNDKWIEPEMEDIISRELFIKVDSKYKNKTIEDLDDRDILDIDKRRELEFCQFMRNNREIDAIKYGVNCLNMNNLLGTDYYDKYTKNIHIISTPNRKVITRYLSERAIEQDYNPIVLAIYGNECDKYHLLIKDKEEQLVDDIMGKGEFNDKLNNLFDHLKKEKVNIDRPIIIIGNYNPTGESLTFVNFKFGTIKGNIRLIPTTMEENYQEGCRINYMTTKFIEHDSNWTAPDKYLIGEKKFINDCLIYEEENDARIDELRDRESGVEDISSGTHLLTDCNKGDSSSTGVKAIPIKLEIEDDSDDKIDQLREIMCPEKKSNHFKPEDKQIILGLIKECVDDGIIKMTDKNNMFNFDGFTLIDVRCWKKKYHNDDPNTWKFYNYKINHNSETPFMNNKNGHNKNECELTLCLDTYSVKNNKGERIINNKNVMWIGYKY